MGRLRRRATIARKSIAQILERTPTRLPENAGDGRSRDRASLA